MAPVPKKWNHQRITNTHNRKRLTNTRIPGIPQRVNSTRKILIQKCGPSIHPRHNNYKGSDIRPEGQWKLNPQQTGFMEGQGTEINIYRLLNQLNKLQLNENNKMIWILFLDFTKAYDMVDH